MRAANDELEIVNEKHLSLAPDYDSFEIRQSVT